tara:strand:+ start:1270 stop:1518 length:249 start_codon:yes stop_codon:yes gene_type:complete
MTAVEWLVKQLNKKIDFIPLNKWDEIRDIIQQAKQMEKEQTEISDEEIEKFADEELGTIRTDFDFGVIQGMKWYREQLKQRQ